MSAEELALLASSPHYEDRIRAAEGLAALGPGAGHDERLRVLLNDPDDSAPAEAAAVALLKREDAWGIDLVLEALGSEEDADVVDKLLFLIGRHFTWQDVGKIGPLVKSRLTHPDARLRSGAEELLATLPWPSLPELAPGRFYEDCRYHPMLCVRLIDDDVEGISLIDGTVGACSVRHCGVQTLTPRGAIARKLWYPHMAERLGWPLEPTSGNIDEQLVDQWPLPMAWHALLEAQAHDPVCLSAPPVSQLRAAPSMGAGCRRHLACD